MRVMLTSAGLETDVIKEHFIHLVNKDMREVKALFIPTAAVDADAVMVLPKCMNDLLKCGILNENIHVYDMHWGMEIEELQQYDVVYLCGGRTQYLLDRINETEFNKSLMTYIDKNGVVLGVSAGSIVFANNLPNNLGLLNTKLCVHCTEGEKEGRVSYPLKDTIHLGNEQAIIILDTADDLEIVGE